MEDMEVEDNNTTGVLGDIGDVDGCSVNNNGLAMERLRGGGGDGDDEISGHDRNALQDLLNKSGYRVY